jgi:diguanylate cyclase (GGDEF)-like protein
MPKFLIVEDSPIVIKILKHLLKEHPSLDYDIAETAAEARPLIESGTDTYFAALVDLNLPDAPNGEVVDECIAKKLPTIVLTGNFDETKRQEIFKKRVVDYIVKESRFSYEYAIKLLNSLHRNKNIKILVADDSSTSRKHISHLLESQLFHVLQADDGDTALQMLEQDSSIQMLITDYNMPRMNGFDLVRQIRKQVDKNGLVIIGLSADGDNSLSAKFIKNGANDFLKKPFSHEEFHCRVMHNIENMEFTKAMHHMAMHDYASGLPNKRAFNEQAEALLKQASKQSREAFIAILSIDQLDELQDRFGIETADLVVNELRELLTSALSRFVYARLSDRDIGITMTGINAEQAERFINGLIERIEDQILMINDQTLQVTVSAGLVKATPDNLIVSCREADNLAYSARQNGGNQLAR